MNRGSTNSPIRRDVVFFVVSFIVHVVVLTWGMITFAAKPIPHNPNEAMPIDIISVTDFSQLTAGARNAPMAETPKPVAEKIAEPKPVDDPNAKIEKKVVNAATDQPPPMPEPRPPAPPEKKQSEPKRDLIADAIKKDLAKKSEPKKSEPKKAETKAPPKKEQPKFDPRKVEALLDKRTPQRLAATGDALNNTAALGAPRGFAAQLSMSELDALRARLAQLWNPPVGASNPDELVVQMRIRLKPDGTLAAPPQVLNSGRSSFFMAASDSAKRAVLRGQPFDMLKPEHYEQWKDIEITFDPRDMIRG
jgi:colicin import membrane protein